MEKNDPKPVVIDYNSDSDPEEFSDAIEETKNEEITDEIPKETKDQSDSFFDVDWQENGEKDDFQDAIDEPETEATKKDCQDQLLKEREEAENILTEEEKQVFKLFFHQIATSGITRQELQVGNCQSGMQRFIFVSLGRKLKVFTRVCT
jgi:DNA-directed RNA polymerase specialized sigma subunit